MKRIGLIATLCSVAVLTFGQALQGSFTSSSISDGDRLSLVKTSIDLPSWEEKTFWPLYETYLSEIKDVSTSTQRSLYDLSGEYTEVDDALNAAQNLFAFRYQELALRKDYYRKMSSEFNGVIALQFLQTEVILDLVETSKIFDQSKWKKFRFRAASIPEERVAEFKHNTMKKAMVIPLEKEETFWKIYHEYEEESSARLGDNYDMLSQFSGPAGDYTPALAKQLGSNMLSVIEREIRLKEKYFLKMKSEAGPEMAVSFIAWEDYFSVINKMHAWAEATN